MKKILILCIISLFLLSVPSLSITGMKITSNIENENKGPINEENDADTPIWEVGHYWTYDITINGGIAPYISINNLKMNDVKFEVDEVLEDNYAFSFSGDITGSFSAQFELIKLSGQFQDTEMEGNFIVNKTYLTIIEIHDAIVDGFIKPNLLPKIPFNAAGEGFLTYGTPILKFPLNNYETWIVSEIEIAIIVDISLIPDPIEDSIYIQGHLANCLEWDIVDVDAGEYDALKISSDLGSEHFTWYSVAAGNVVKIRGRDLPLSFGSLGEYDFDIELVDTNFHIDSDPPTTPTTLTGPTEVVVGFAEEYIAGGSTDPDGDLVRYIINWGDGTQSGSDFEEEGQDIALEHYWTSKGTYEVKVKARDKYGAQSDWSDPITVTVTNEPPLKPEPPDGPISGWWRKTHTYTATTTDPDGHRIRFRFDWGDGQSSYSQLVESGETGSASHRWRWPNTYTIKVKAVDEFGEGSPWSDPITVTMPRGKATIRPFLRFFDNHPSLFPILQRLLLRLGQ